MTRDDASAATDGEVLAVAMTRPAMLGGFTLTSLGISFYIPGMTMLITRSLWAALMIPPLLLASYLVCLKDIYLFDIALAACHLRRCPNARIWGGRRYAPR